MAGVHHPAQYSDVLISSVAIRGSHKEQMEDPKQAVGKGHEVVQAITPGTVKR